MILKDNLLSVHQHATYYFLLIILIPNNFPIPKWIDESALMPKFCQERDLDLFPPKVAKP